MKGMPTGEKPKAHYPRTSHDFSARRVYHNKVGMITPIKPIDSVPNEHFEIEVSDFLQSMPLATAAFLRGRREFAFYYVPYHQLWSNFGQYMAQRKDRYSSAMKDSKFEPRVSLRILLKWCANVFFFDLARKYPQYIRPNGNPITTDSEILPINTLIFHVEGPTGFNTDLFTKATERGQSFGYTFVTHPFVNNDIVTYRTPKVGEYVLDKFGQSRWSNMLRKLDLLRYGNYLMFFSKVYDAIESLILSDSEIKESDMAPIENLIFDLLYQINLLPDNYYVEPYRILAYNKCYYTFFRNSYYELDYFVGDFNVDHLECSSLESSILSPMDFSVQFLDMYQHQWKKDMFTSLMPDTQFGAVSQFMVTSQDVIGTGGNFGSVTGLTSVQNTFNNPSGAPAGAYDAEINVTSGGNAQLRIGNDFPLPLGHNHSFSNAQVSISQGQDIGISVISAGDVLALRRAEAIQGYRQTLLRCGNKTKDIMVGLFGVEPVWESDHDPDFIDSFGYDYAVDRVVSTAQTNEELDTYNGKLGDLGGYIAKLGGTRRNIKYTTRGDFGLILPVCYEIIESEYNSYNIDPNILALTPEDHGIPDFMNLGFVPVTRRILSLLDPRQARFASPYVVPNVDQVLGYGTPYYEKKIDVDICHGILNTFGELQNEGSRKFAGNDYVGDFAHWVAPRTDMQSSFVTTTKQFYIDPRILNNNFLLAANGRQETDQFICNTYFKVRRVNWMSDLGLPNF